MKIQLILLLTLLVISIFAHNRNEQVRVPLGTPFSGWSKVSQTAEGWFYSHVNLPPSYNISDSYGPAKFIINPNEKMYVINITENIGGIQWTLPNGTYFLIRGVCSFDDTYGKYDDMVNSYLQAVKIQEIGAIDVYSGLVNDFATCGLGIGTTIYVSSEDNSIIEQTFGEWAPSPIPNFSFTVVGRLTTPYARIGKADIPALPEECWSLNVSQISNQYCKINYFPNNGFAPPPPIPPEVLAAQKCQRMMGKIQKLYETIVYPNPIAVIHNETLVSDIFDINNSKARISPLGAFPGFQGVVEYFYGLAALPTTQVVSVDVKKLSCNATTGLVQSYVNLLFNTFDTNVPQFPTYNLTQTGSFTFNLTTELVNSVDAVIWRLGQAEDISNKIDPYTGINSRYLTTEAICQLTVYGIPELGVMNGTCLGPYDIWNNTMGLSRFDYCMLMLTDQILNPFNNKTIPFGSFNRADSNTVSCRTIHNILTIFRPEVHCPHVSPSGGDACKYFSYESFYQENY